MEHKEASRKRTIGNSANTNVPKTEKRKAERLKSTYKIVSSFAHLEKSEKASPLAITVPPPNLDRAAQVAPVHCRSANGESPSSLWSKLGGLHILSLDMIVHECADFFGTCAELDDAAERLSQVIPSNKILDGNDPVFVLQPIENVVKILKVLGVADGGFEVDVRTVYDHVKSLFGGVWYGIFDVRADELARDYRRIREGLFAEIKKHKFVSLPAAGVEYFDQERLFGDDVYEKFPSSRYDLREAGNALAFELHTACVFHLMRVLEFGLRAMAQRFSVPYESACWHNVIEGIEGQIRKINKDAGGPDWKKQQKEYSDAATQFMFFKDAWRNHIMHVRDMYDAGRATSIFQHVQEFMEKLAAIGLKENLVE